MATNPMPNHRPFPAEAYHHLVIKPGQTVHWDIRYRFYAK
jgi:hypothetical protein